MQISDGTFARGNRLRLRTWFHAWIRFRPLCKGGPGSPGSGCTTWWLANWKPTLGLNGVVWITAVVIAAVFAWMFRLLMARGVNVVIALLLVLLALWASTIHFLARPHVMSWLFTLAWFVILDSSERDSLSGDLERGGRWLWTLPLLMLVWVNVHGGFLLGFVLWGIFLLGAAWSWFRAKDNRIEEVLQKIAAGKRLRALGWVGLLSAGASLVNPYGWNLHRHAYSYLVEPVSDGSH